MFFNLFLDLQTLASIQYTPAFLSGVIGLLDLVSRVRFLLKAEHVKCCRFSLNWTV